MRRLIEGMKVEGFSRLLNGTKTTIVKIQHCMMLLLLSSEHLIVDLEFSHNFFSLSMVSMGVEKGCVSVPFLQPTNS